MFRRVAIVHDWLIAMRGGERVLESLCALFPAADIYTLCYDADRVSPTIARHRVTTSFIDRLAKAPFVRGRFRGLLPLFPLAAESFSLEGYDLVVSSSHCVAAGVLAPPGALHVAYLHSPMRYAWEGQTAYARTAGGGRLGGWALRAATHYLRLWDFAASARPDLLLANSGYTQRRIRRYYRRDAEVIEPPIDTARFASKSGLPASGATHAPSAVGMGAIPALGERGRSPDLAAEAPWLLVSALVPYKRVALAVEAMAGRTERLVVVGEGPERARLERMAGPNVRFAGWVSDEELTRLFAECRALIHPAVDDFGMVMVEAMAAGKPVVASRDGGAAGIVRDGETGVFFESATVEALRAALDRVTANHRFDSRALRQTAERYDRANFERRFLQAVERAYADRERPPDGALEPRARPRQLGLGRP